MHENATIGFMEEDLEKRRKKVLRDGLVVAFSLLIGLILHQSNFVQNFVHSTYGFTSIIGIFISGIFFASTFTVAISSSLFLLFSQNHNPLYIALIGGLGAVIGDSFIFKFLRNDLLSDFEYIERYFPKQTLKRVIHSKMIFWLAPLIAAILIASPFPDEIGLVMLASIRLKYHHFFLISFFLNTIGILVISLFGRIF